MQITPIPKLSNDLAQIRLTYDRINRGVKLELIHWKKGEEKLIPLILKGIAEKVDTDEFRNAVLIKEFERQIQRLH